MKIEENKSLAELTTFGIGGAARWFCAAGSEDDIAEAARWASSRRLPLLVLGGGSNVLVADGGFHGLAVWIGLKGIEVSQFATGSGCEYSAAAGEEWDAFVQRTIDDGCAGIECLAGIPGRVGGTPVQNVGAYGQEVSQTIVSVRALDLREGVFRTFTNAECRFGYRRSRFNTADRGRYAVTHVRFSLRPHGHPKIEYAELRSALDAVTPRGTQPELAEVAAAVRRLRFNKGMLLVAGDPDCRSAGSFFKNPVVSAAQAAQIASASDRPLPGFAPGSGAGAPAAGMVKIPAAWLIEQSGFARGFRLGAAAISSRHTLALVNLGGATAEQVVALAARIEQEVESRFGIRLEREPVLIGFD